MNTVLTHLPRLLCCMGILIQAQIFVDPSSTVVGNGSELNPYNSLNIVLQTVQISPNQQSIYLKGTQEVISTIVVVNTSLTLTPWAGYAAALRISEDASLIISGSLSLDDLDIIWNNPHDQPFINAYPAVPVSLTVRPFQYTSH